MGREFADTEISARKQIFYCTGRKGKFKKNQLQKLYIMQMSNSFGNVTPAFMFVICHLAKDHLKATAAEYPIFRAHVYTQPLFFWRG